MRLATLVDFVGGGTPSRKIKNYYTGNIPWATSKDIKSRYLDDAQEHITEEAIHNSATTSVPVGTTLMVVKSKILMHTLPLGITTKRFCFSQDLKGLVCKSAIDPRFIMAALLAQESRILNWARGVNTEGLTLNSLRKIPIPNPNTDQYQAFIDQLNIYDQFDEPRFQSKHQIDLLFDSVMVRAFSGRLTRDYRQQNKSLISQAEAERDRLLALSISQVVDVPDTQIDIERHWLLSALHETQKALLDVVNSTEIYSTLSNLQNDFDLPSNQIQRNLDLLTQMGLIKAVSVPIAPSERGQVFYTTMYRALRPEDETMATDIALLQAETERLR